MHSASGKGYLGSQKVSGFPDVGEVALASHEELPEEIDSKDKQKWRLR